VGSGADKAWGTTSATPGKADFHSKGIKNTKFGYRCNKNGAMGQKE